jgi:hypothetical protein
MLEIYYAVPGLRGPLGQLNALQLTQHSSPQYHNVKLFDHDRTQHSAGTRAEEARSRDSASSAHAKD